jgi:membrane-associated phospholipid phosphatase
VKRALIVALLVLPSLARAEEPAYKLRLDVDLALLTIGALAPIGGAFDVGPAWCAPQCDPNSLNALDKPFAGRYQPGWTTAGTVAAAFLIAAPPGFLFAYERPLHALNDVVVIAEAVLLADALDTIFKMSVRRPRPFMYGETAPLADRLDTNGALSFYSGHTTLSFAATIATWRTLDRLDVAPRWKWLFLGVGLAGSSFVGISRVVAGDHFPSDVLVGAGMGTAFGLLLPALHDRGVAIAPTYTADALLLSAVGRF